MKDSSICQKGSIRTINITDGIKALICRPKNKETTTIITYLFDVKKFTMKEAKDWISKHKGSVDSQVEKIGGNYEMNNTNGKNRTFVIANLTLCNGENHNKILDTATVDEVASSRYFFTASMVHQGENSNGDVFTQEELIASYKTARHNPVDWEHNRAELLGSTFSSELIPAKDDKPVALSVEGVLWRNVPAMIKDNRDAIIRKRFSEGSLKVSMECWFSRAVCQTCGFSSDDMLEFERHRVSHIEMLEKGKRPPRILVGIEWAGIGLVENPADTLADALIMDDQSLAKQFVQIGDPPMNYDITVTTNSSGMPCYYSDEDINKIVSDAVAKFKGDIENVIIEGKEKLKADGINMEKETKTEGEKWTREYINTLEDDCFAVVEPGYKKDSSNKNMRHLSHHPKGHGNGSGSGSVQLDPAHFRNALARCNQIQAVSDSISTEALRSKASKHLEAHRKLYEKQTGGSNIMLEKLLEGKINKFADITEAFKNAMIEISLQAEDTYVAKRGKFEDLADEFKSALLKFLSNIEEGSVNEKAIKLLFEDEHKDEQSEKVIGEIKKSLEKAQEDAKIKEKDVKAKEEIIGQLTDKVQQYEKDIAEKEKNAKIEKALKEIESQGVQLGDSKKKTFGLLARIIDDEEAVKSFIKDLVSFFNTIKITTSSLKNGNLSSGNADEVLSVVPHLDEVEKKYKNKKEE